MFSASLCWRFVLALCRKACRWSRAEGLNSGSSTVSVIEVEPKLGGFLRFLESGEVDGETRGGVEIGEELGGGEQAACSCVWPVAMPNAITRLLMCSWAPYAVRPE